MNARYFLAVPGLTMVGIAVGLVSYAVFTAPTPQRTLLGLRGLKRKQAAERSLIWRALAPLVEWLAQRVAPFLSNAVRSRLDRRLTLAGDVWGLNPEELVSLAFLLVSGGALLGATYAKVTGGSVGLAYLAGLAGAALPMARFISLEQERAKEIQHELPLAIDLISLALSAGLDFTAALRQVLDNSTTSTPTPLTEEIALMLHELKIGKTRRQSLEQFKARAPYDCVVEFVNAVVQADEQGHPLAQVLTVQAESSRERRSVRAEEAAAKASVKLIVPLLLVFVAVCLLMFAPMVMELSSIFGAAE